MQTYAAIDLHSNNSVLTVIDQTDRILRQRKLRNELPLIIRELEPFRETLQGVAVESTFNWYWLVDGLVANGHRAMLVNTSAIQQYEGLKHADDAYDAWWLAHMMRLGILPTGYIHPPQSRAVRDLLRKPTTLVQQRTANILSVQNLEQRNRGTKITGSDVKRLTAAEINTVYADPDRALAITSTLAVIEALNAQIKVLEKTVEARAKLRPEFEPLRTVWGIGNILALTIMFEAGNMGRFASAGNFASYARCVKATRWSNGKKKGDNNAKNGNRYLAWAFTEAAHFAIRYYPEARSCYDRKAAKTNRTVAIKTIAHKIARAVFHVLRERVPFEPKKVFV